MFRPQGTFPWLSTVAPFRALGSRPGPQTQMPSWGQTGNWGQGKWTGLRGEVCYSASQWLLHFWNLRLQSPSSPTPSLIVYLLALEMDCAFFKDALQASAGGPDRTRLRARMWSTGASLQPPIWPNSTFPVSCVCPSHSCLCAFA